MKTDYRFWEQNCKPYYNEPDERKTSSSWER